ncbi:MAG: hypothetical protein E4G90_00525 [Gemmatimonadales bacterium]|nr:MAG: hypothetical protein E4G90_00525 [Gemmatimonadales bacterium]
MRRLRIVFFGTAGPVSLGALREVAAGHTIAAVVQPRPELGSAGRARRLLGGVARALGVRLVPAFEILRRQRRFPAWEARSGRDAGIVARLQALRPDLLCIAGYPWILSAGTLTIAPLGAINVHAALLPRHRGPLPLFWIYYHNDRQTGVTVHRAIVEADAGDILGQVSFPLPRGLPVEELNRINGEYAARALGPVLRDLDAGRAVARPQDETLATLAPRIRPGTPMIEFASWDVERVWHFMAGLYPRFVEPLSLEDGVSVRYRGIHGYERTPHRLAPGTVRRVAGGADLYCLGGRVRLAVGG